MLASRPNVLIITTHDTGRHFGCYGNPAVHTPVIDSIAKNGVRLSNYFATVPICSASRASMMTGLYPQAHGLMDLCGPAFGWRLRNYSQHLSHLMRSDGYHTCMFGFQHEAHGTEHLGFDEIRARDIPPSDRTAHEVAAFLGEWTKRDRPFYAQVGFFETHTPFERGGVEPDESNGVYVPPYLVRDEDSVRQMALFQGAVRKVDGAVGIILDALRANGLEQDTLLVFTTDHGIEMPRSKWYLYDPGIAIGLVMQWSGGGITGGIVCDCLLSNVDFLPTVLELAGVPVPDYVQGTSFVSNIRDPAAAAPREAVYGLYHKTSTRYVRTNRYKFIRHFDFPYDFHTLPVSFADQQMKRGIPHVELFDFDADPNEFENVSESPEYADVCDQLSDMLWCWLESVEDPILQGPVRSPSYDRAMDDYAAWHSTR